MVCAKTKQMLGDDRQFDVFFINRSGNLQHFEYSVCEKVPTSCVIHKYKFKINSIKKWGLNYFVWLSTDKQVDAIPDKWTCWNILSNNYKADWQTQPFNTWYYLLNAVNIYSQPNIDRQNIIQKNKSIKNVQWCGSVYVWV